MVSGDGHQPRARRTRSAASSPGATDTLVNDRFGAAVQADQLLPWGANYNVTWNNTRAKSNSVFDSPNPALGAMLGGSYTQPLLRNFKIDSTRQQLLISKKNREMTDVQLRQTVLSRRSAQVKNAYWDLAYALENLKVQQQSLDIARESLRNNKSRVGIGTMAPIDIIEAEAEVARNEEAVIIAEAQITRAEDALRAADLRSEEPGLLERRRFELTDPPVVPGAGRGPGCRREARPRQPHRPGEHAEEPRGDRHQHPVLQEPDPARPERAGRLRPDRTGRHATTRSPTRSLRFRSPIVDNGWGSVYSRRCSATTSTTGRSR